MAKSSFVLYTRYMPLLDSLNDKELAGLMRAVFKYASDGSEPTFRTKAERIAFAVIKEQLDYDCEKYDRIVKRNRENGKKHTSVKCESTQGECDKTEKKESARSASPCRTSFERTYSPSEIFGKEPFKSDGIFTFKGVYGADDKRTFKGG